MKVGIIGRAARGSLQIMGVAHAKLTKDLHSALPQLCQFWRLSGGRE